MHAVIDVLAQVPSFGVQAPPGSDKLSTIGGWVLWCASALCVIGIITIGAMMTTSHQHGEMQQHGKRLGAAMAGCVIVGTATGIAGALI